LPASASSKWLGILWLPRRRGLSGILTQPKFLFDVAWGSNSRMTAQKKDQAHEELLSVLRRAKNRLEYITPNDWILIVDHAKRVAFKKDDALILSGKQQKTVYLLIKGKARVESASKVLIAQLEPGEICGEMAFLENGIASANVTATSDVETCAIEGAALLDLFELYPHLGSRFYRSLAVNLSRRLRDVIGTRPLAKLPG
jgi:hypothetical protein